MIHFMSKKIIAVLGAGPGLGVHIGKEFGNHDFRVILLARGEDALRNYTRELGQAGIEADYHVADCSDNLSIKSALTEVSQKYGGIDVLVYNTAVLLGGSPLTLTPDELVSRYQVDVAGALCAVQQVVPYMKEQKSGAILLTGGGLALDPAPGVLSVSLHKAALRALAAALHKELSGDGIYTGIVTIKGGIGSDDYYSPARIAGLFYQLYEKQNETEIIY